MNRLGRLVLLVIFVALQTMSPFLHAHAASGGPGDGGERATGRAAVAAGDRSGWTTPAHRYAGEDGPFHKHFVPQEGAVVEVSHAVAQSVSAGLQPTARVAPDASIPALCLPARATSLRVVRPAIATVPAPPHAGPTPYHQPPACGPPAA